MLKFYKVEHMHNIITKYFLFLFFIISFSPQNAFSYMREPVIISTPYKNQNFFTCNGINISIPPYFPSMDSSTEKGLFLSAYEKECKKDSFKIILGIDKDCGGQNFCLRATFSSDKLGEGVFSRLDAAFAVFTKEIELADGSTGYFAPSQCFAYCNEAKFIWFDRNQKINIIGLHTAQDSQETIDQLVKSANSYIKLLKEQKAPQD